MDLDQFETVTPGSAGTRTPLLRVLVDAGVASEEELQQAFAEGAGRGESLGEVALRRGLVDDVGLAQALARQWSLPCPKATELDGDAAAKADAAAWKELQACPVRSPDGRVTVAVAEPTEQRLRSVRAVVGSESQFAVVTAAALNGLLTQAAAAEADARPDTAAAPAAEEIPAEESFAWLERELDATAAQLVALRERVALLVASEKRREEELATAREHAAKLRESRLADAVRIQTLETALAEREQRAATIAATLADAARALGR